MHVATDMQHMAKTGNQEVDFAKYLESKPETLSPRHANQPAYKHKSFVKLIRQKRAC